MPQSVLLMDWRGGLFSPTDMICYLSGQVTVEEVMVVPMGKPPHILHTAAPSVVEWGRQHRQSRRSRSLCAVHKTQALFSVTSGWQAKNSISVKFLYWHPHIMWLFLKYVVAGVVCEVLCGMCTPYKPECLWLTLTMSPKFSVSSFFCLRHWKRTLLKWVSPPKPCSTLSRYQRDSEYTYWIIYLQ